MHGSTVALLVLGAAGAGGGAWYLYRRSQGVAEPFGELLGLAPAGGYASVAPPAGPSQGPPAPKSFTSSAADVLANKAITGAICKGVSTFYTGGAANGACGAVAAVANKVTEVQIKATMAVAKAIAPTARKVGSVAYSASVGWPIAGTKAVASKVGSVATSTVKAIGGLF